MFFKHSSTNTSTSDYYILASPSIVLNAHISSRARHCYINTSHSTPRAQAHPSFQICLHQTQPHQHRPRLHQARLHRTRLHQPHLHRPRLYRPRPHQSCLRQSCLRQSCLCQSCLHQNHGSTTFSATSVVATVTPACVPKSYLNTIPLADIQPALIMVLHELPLRPRRAAPRHVPEKRPDATPNNQRPLRHLLLHFPLLCMASSGAQARASEGAL